MGFGIDINTDLKEVQAMIRPDRKCRGKFIDSGSKDFDWEAFKAEGDSGSTISRSQQPVDVRDTTQFQDVARFMRNNAPKYTPVV